MKDIKPFSEHQKAITALYEANPDKFFCYDCGKELDEWEAKQSAEETGMYVCKTCVETCVRCGKKEIELNYEGEDLVCLECFKSSYRGEVKQMPNVNDLSEFLQVTDVKDGDFLQVLDAGIIEEVDFSKTKDGKDLKKRLKIKVQLPSGKKKSASINATSSKAISEQYGPDTEGWVGKSIKVVLVKQNVGGDLKDVIYFEPVKEV